METTEPGTLPGMRAITFRARTRSLDEDPLTEVLRQSSEWIIAHRQDACPISIEFDQYSDTSLLRDLPPDVRLLRSVIPTEEHHVVHHAVATLHYDDMTEGEHREPRVVEWHEIHEPTKEEA